MEPAQKQPKLHERLAQLRNALLACDSNIPDNLVFLDEAALYTYLSESTWQGKKIELLWDTVADCIPIGLSDRSLTSFLLAVYSEEPEDSQYFWNHFKMLCRLDFAKLLKEADDATKWKRLLTACETLKRCRSKEAFFHND